MLFKPYLIVETYPPDPLPLLREGGIVLRGGCAPLRKLLPFLPLTPVVIASPSAEGRGNLYFCLCHSGESQNPLDTLSQILRHSRLLEDLFGEQVVPQNDI